MGWSRSFKLSLVFLFAAGISVAFAHSAGPSPGYTGAPGEFTCRQCHSSNPLNDGVGSVTIEGVPDRYAPGVSYTITVRVAHPDRRRWGFQLTALTGALDPAGSFTITDPTHTQVKTDDGKSYVSHRTAGTYAGTPNGASWSFRWTAPATDLGPIDFYACANAANNNSASTGDNIYSTFATAEPEAIVVPFTDVTEASGLGPDVAGSGVAWADFDGDGDQDALISRDGPVELLRNDGGVFTDVAEATGLGTVADARSAAWGDFDNDGRPDLVVATAVSTRLLRNTSAGFVDAGTTGWFAVAGPAQLASWLDVDGDGWLDLVVASDGGTVLLHNEHGAGFSDTTQASGLSVLTGVTAVTGADDNGDGRVDLAVIAGGRFGLYRQTDSGAFADETSSSGIPAIGSALDVAWADVDSDGRLDLVVASGTGVHALRNAGFGVYQDLTDVLGLADVQGGAVTVADADGDGRQDLLVTRASGVELLTFDGSTFADQTDALGLGSAAGDAATWVDADGDGHPDLFVVGGGAGSLHRNPSTAPATTVRAVSDGGRDAIGSVVTFTKGVTTIARLVDGGGGRAQAPPVATFPSPGFGTATIRVEFADGTGRQTVIAPGTPNVEVPASAEAPSVASAFVKKKDDGALKLQVDGSGFATSVEIVEVDGAAMDATRYPQAKRLPDGTSTRISGTDSAFEAMVPRGRAVHIRTYNPTTGVRSAPLVFVR